MQRSRESLSPLTMQSMTIAMEGDDKADMVIGPEDFPLPIPLVRKDELWRFDTAAGRQEIIVRRIGQNELDAIQVALAYVDARDQYAEKDRTGDGVGTYAERIISQPGKKDGLYWPTSQGEEPSPLGELVAQATAGLSHGRWADALPRLLFQDPDKAGSGRCRWRVGVRRKRQDDRRICASRLSRRIRKIGRDDVIVIHAGTVFQKDLRPDTARLAERMSAFNPDRTWQQVSDTAPLH